MATTRFIAPTSSLSLGSDETKVTMRKVFGKKKHIEGVAGSQTTFPMPTKPWAVYSETHGVTHRHTLSTVTHTQCKHRQIFLLANTLSLRRQNMPNDNQPTFVETGLMTSRTMAMAEAKQRSGFNVSSKRKQNPTNKRRQHCLTGNSAICISYPQVYKELWLALEQLFKS